MNKNPHVHFESLFAFLASKNFYLSITHFNICTLFLFTAVVSIVKHTFFERKRQCRCMCVYIGRIHRSVIWCDTTHRCCCVLLNFPHVFDAVPDLSLRVILIYWLALSCVYNLSLSVLAPVNAKSYNNEQIFFFFFFFVVVVLFFFFSVSNVLYVYRSFRLIVYVIRLCNKIEGNIKTPP